jgi:hypothetical protein
MLVQAVDVGVRPWKEQALVPRVAPADSERRLPIGTGLENLRVTLWFPDSMRPDHDPITYFSLHDRPPDNSFSSMMISPQHGPL